MPAPSEVEGTTESKTFCKWCKQPLPDNHSGPCPNCGKIGRHIKIEPLTGVLRLTGTVTRITRRRREIVKDKRIKWASRSIGLICASLGLLLSLLSLPILYSVIVPIASYFITDYLSPFVLQKLIKPKQ